MNKIDKLVEEYFTKKQNVLSSDVLLDMIKEEMERAESKHFPKSISIAFYDNEQIQLSEEMIAGLNIKTNKSPSNSGDIAEGIFILGLLSAMKNGTSEPNDILGMINYFRDKVTNGNTLMVNLGAADVPHFASLFNKSAPINVKMTIKLKPSQMAALFIPLDAELPELSLIHI